MKVSLIEDVPKGMNLLIDMLESVSNQVKELASKVESTDPDHLDRPMSKKEVADHFGVTLNTVGNWVKKGQLNTYRKGGRRVYFKRSDVMALKG